MDILDEKDMKILEVLKEHSNFSTRKIAKKTLLPSTTINNRIRRMIKEGIIKNFTINLDNRKIGKGFLVYILINVNIELLKQKKKTQYDILKEMRRFYFIEQAHIVSGGTDIVATVRVKDVSEFDNALLGKLQLLEGVANTRSLIVIHQE